LAKITILKYLDYVTSITLPELFNPYLCSYYIKSKSKMTYTEIINSETPTLVDFTATWCGPCKAMAPVLEQLASRIGEKGKIIKIDVDKNPGIAEKMKIQGVPTFVLYKKGEILWRQSGMQSLTQLEKLIEGAQ